MQEVRTDIEINAPPEKIWEVLIDFERYDEWNPVMEIEGSPTEGTRLDLTLTYPNQSPTKIRPKVATVNEPSEFRWEGQLFIPHLYDVEHKFVLESFDQGTRTRFIHSESFRGIAVRLINRIMGADIQEGFEQMNASLKQRVEAT